MVFAPVISPARNIFPRSLNEWLFFGIQLKCLLLREGSLTNLSSLQLYLHLSDTSSSLTVFTATLTLCNHLSFSFICLLCASLSLLSSLPPPPSQNVNSMKIEIVPVWFTIVSLVLSTQQTLNKHLLNGWFSISLILILH